MNSLSNHQVTPESLAKVAEGHSGVGSTTTEPIQTDARQSFQPAVSGNVLKSKRATSSMEESAEEKVQQRIRAASLCCDVRRTGLVSTQFTSRDTVRVLNDQTGQSIVVASNQSTRDALASLVQRESEAEKKEAAAIKLAKEESELRAMMLEQQNKTYFEEQELKKLEAVSSSPPRPRPQSAQPKKRNNYRQQAFAEPMAISTQEAQALLITYLNYTQPEFSGISYQFLAEQHGISPALSKMQPPVLQSAPKPKRSSSQKPKSTKTTKKDSVTATAIVFDTSPSILVNQLEMKPTIAPEPTPPTTAPQINRAYFGISRFLDSAEGTVAPTPSAPVKPKKTAKKPASKTIKSSTSTETADKKTTAKKPTIKAAVISEETKMEEVVTAAAAPVPCEPSPPDTNTTQRSIIFNDPMVAIAAAIHDPPQEPARQPEPEDPERSRLFLWAPGTRSNRGKSDSPSLHKTDAELIEFLRKPLEKAREEEREAARRKMMDPSPKRKPRSAVNARNASKSSNSSTSNSNQPPTTEAKTLESQTSEPVEATLQDSLFVSQSPPCDFLDDHLLDSAFEDYDFADFQHSPESTLYAAFEQTLLEQQTTTDFSSGTTESYRSLRLDMPLGQAMNEVPLESIAGHLQTQKELFFLKKEGKLPAIAPDMYSTGEQQNLQSSQGVEPTLPTKKKPPPKRRQPPKPTSGDGAETAQPKRKRAPPKKKGAPAAEEQQVQNVVQVDSQMQMYQHQPTLHSASQPTHQPAQQRLPSVDNLLPPINGHYQQSNYGRAGSQETNGQSSSSTSYQSYQYSMNTQAERPKKQQSLASMLQPLNNTGSSSQGQQQAAVDNNNYQNGMMYSMGANGNGEFYGYDDHNSQMSADYTGDGQVHFAPLSVESHISYQSQESNSHMSSMPQTPISNHGSVYNNPVVSDNQMSYTQHNYGQQNDLFANQEYFAPVDNHNQQQYHNGNMQNGGNHASDQHRYQNRQPSQQQPQQLHQQQQQQSQPPQRPQQLQSQQPHQSQQPVGELQRLTPMDITEFFSDPSLTEPYNTNSNNVHSANGHYSNGQILASNDNVRFMPDGRQEILNFVGEDEECEMSTCPADCNKCQSKEATPKPPPIEVVQDTKAVVIQKNVPNVTNGSTILKPDAEQISYVQYLAPSGNRSLSETIKAAPKRKPRSKKKADPKAPENDIFQSASLDSFPENMSIGELLKKRNQFHPNVFMSAANRSMPQLSLLGSSDGASSSSAAASSSSSSPASTAMLPPGQLSLSDVQMMIDSRQQMDVRSHSISTSPRTESHVHSYPLMDVEPPVQRSAPQPLTQPTVQPATYQRIPPPPQRKIAKPVRRRPTPPSQPSCGDPVLDTIQTVISNVMGVNDALEQYLPVEELNIPESIKLQHKKAIETTRQHQENLKLQAEKQQNNRKKPEVKKPVAKKPNAAKSNVPKPVVTIPEIVNLEDEDPEIQIIEGNVPNYSMEELRMMYQDQNENEPSPSSFFMKAKTSLIEIINAKRRAQILEERRRNGVDNDVFPITPVKILTEEELQREEEKRLKRKRREEADYEKMLEERRKLYEYLRQKKEREQQQQQLQQLNPEEQRQPGHNQDRQTAHQPLQNQELQNHQHQQQHNQMQHQDQHQRQLQNLRRQQDRERRLQRQQWYQQEEDRQQLLQHQAERDIHFPESYQQRRQSPQQFQRYQQPQQQSPAQPRPQQRRLNGQSSSQSLQNGQAVIQHFDLPPRPYPSKLAQLLQKPHGTPYTTPKTVQQSPMMHLFDQPACQPSTSLQAAQRAAQEEAEFEAMEAAQPRSPVFFQRPSVEPPRADPPRGNPPRADLPRPDPPRATPRQMPPPPRTRPSSSSTGSSKSNPNSRSYRVRECIRSVLAMGPLTPEEALGRPEGGDTDDFNQEYMEHWNRTTQDMIDNPCVPEITVDDVLEQPELEPALHGRFRKRLAAVRAGKTTVTKPPPKKKRTMPDDACCSSTVTTTEQSTSTATESEPSTSTATTTKTKSRTKSTTTIKAIVVPSLDLLQDGSGPSTSTEVLSQPLSVLTNDNTNSMGPSPLVSGVQTPVEPNLNNQQLDYLQEDLSNQFSSTPYSYTMSFTDGNNTYNRTAGNPMPYNILEGEDDVVDEEELRRQDEESRMLLVETNQVGRRRAPTTHFSFDELIDNGPRGALINDNNDPFLGSMHHNQSNDDPFLSDHPRPRGPFDFDDDEDFDIDKDVIDLNGSEDTGPSTPSVGILDDPSFDSVFFH